MGFHFVGFFFFLVLQFAPVSGKVVSINEELGTQPSLLNKSPEDKGTARAVFFFLIHIRLLRPFIIGWLFRLKVTNPKEVDIVRLVRTALLF
jgi:glycine cleavage system H protein